MFKSFFANIKRKKRISVLKMDKRCYLELCLENPTQQDYYSAKVIEVNSELESLGSDTDFYRFHKVKTVKS